MSPPTHLRTIREARHRPSGAHRDAAGLACGPWSTRRKGGLLAAIAVALSCGVTTALLAAGVLATGGGLLGSPELTVLAVLAPLLVLAWHGRAHLRRRRAHHDPHRDDPPRSRQEDP